MFKVYYLLIMSIYKMFYKQSTLLDDNEKQQKFEIII